MTDPLFVDAAGADYKLQTASPGIDAGKNADWLPAYDMGDNSRITDGDGDNIYRVDMGAYELTGSPAPVTCELSDDEDCDSVFDDSDICPGFNDSVDSDGDSVPDGCDRCENIDDQADDIW